MLLEHPKCEMIFGALSNYSSFQYCSKTSLPNFLYQFFASFLDYSPKVIDIPTIQKRSHELMHKTDTKNEAKRLRATTFTNAKLKER